MAGHSVVSLVRIAQRTFGRQFSVLLVNRCPIAQTVNCYGAVSPFWNGNQTLTKRVFSSNRDGVESGGEKLARRKFEENDKRNADDLLTEDKFAMDHGAGTFDNRHVRRAGGQTWLGVKWEGLMDGVGLRIDRAGSKEDQSAQKRKRSTVLATVFVGGGAFCGFLYFCIYYGWMKRDGESEHAGILAPYHRIRSAYKSWKDFVIEPSREKLLPEPFAAPYHQPKYTLVIEMMNVLVAPEWSYKTGNRLKRRPALEYFLDLVGYPNFEVVIYTSENGLTANPVVDALDTKQRIMYRLYRDCTKYMNGNYVKDLSRLNRDLSKVIYIDFDPNSFQLNPENVLRLPKWNGNLDDTSLVDLAELLKTIHLSDVDDVRPTLQYYSQFDDPLQEFRKRATHVANLEKELETVEVQRQASNAPVKKYQGRMFGFRRHE